MDPGSAEHRAARHSASKDARERAYGAALRPGTQTATVKKKARIKRAFEFIREGSVDPDQAVLV
jgi:hypothetical protein